MYVLHAQTAHSAVCPLTPFVGLGFRLGVIPHAWPLMTLGSRRSAVTVLSPFEVQVELLLLLGLLGRHGIE